MTKIEKGKWYKCIKTASQYSWGRENKFVAGQKYKLVNTFNYGVEHILQDEKGFQSPFNIVDNNFECFFEQESDY